RFKIAKFRLPITDWLYTPGRYLFVSKSPISGAFGRMEIISFATEESDWKRPRPGAILNDEYLIDFAATAPEQPLDSLSWFDLDAVWFQTAREKWQALKTDPTGVPEAAANGLLVKRKDAYWFAPVPRPGKLICIGLNYRDHAAESNMAIPER